MIQTAALFFNNGYYYSRYSPLAHEPHSAATQLIQGIFEQFPEQALHILRNRIVLSYQPTLLCRGMISVAAKRFAIDLNLNQKLSEANQSKVLIKYRPKSEGLLSEGELNRTALKPWLNFTEETIEQVKNSQPLYQKNRLVRSALLDRQKNIMMMAENRNSKNKTKHAEVQLLQAYFERFQKGFEKKNYLLTSLQCCKMCAAMVWHMQVDPFKNLEVYFAEKELGSSARDTILTVGGNLRRAIYSDSHLFMQIIERDLKDLRL